MVTYEAHEWQGVSKIDYAQEVHGLSFYFSAELKLQTNKLFLLL